MGWVTALTLAALATGGWAAAQDSGNGPDSGAPAAQQSQPQGFGGRFGRPGAGDHRWDPRRDRGWHRRDEGFGRFRGPFMRRAAASAALRLDAPLLGAFRQLNLSDAQRERVREVLLNARISALQAREKQGAATDRQQFAALLNPGDPNYARAVQAAKDRAVDRIERATQTQQALYNVLTPAQKTQLTQILAQRRERMQQRGRAAQQPDGHG